jgi:pimeloyl-ACP methyl ester carboxylesterase
MHGGWCWRRVARMLRDAGADVWTPTLTGLGERVHLNGPHIGLSTHIEDVVNCIEYEELSKVCLVGHSYAGMVITGAAERLDGKLSNLVYLDAVVPRSGENALQAMGGLELDESVKMFSAVPGTDFGISDQVDLAWVQRHLTLQSAQTLREPLVLQGDFAKIKRTYIACTADKRTGSPTDNMRRAARERMDATWRTKELPAAHDAMVTSPRDLSDMLLDIARSA